MVPRRFQRQVFETIHNLAHPSRQSTLKLVAQKFIWRGLKNRSSNGHKNVYRVRNLRSIHTYRPQL